MKTIIITTLTLFSFYSYAQNHNKDLIKIKTVEQATDYINKNPQLSGEIVEINTGIDSSEICKKLIESKTEKPITIGDYSYKVIEIKQSYLLRVSYIFLNGNQLSTQKIDSIRTVIMTKYKGGTPFPDLAKTYNMDGNPTCDFAGCHMRCAIMNSPLQ